MSKTVIVVICIVAALLALPILAKVLQPASPSAPPPTAQPPAASAPSPDGAPAVVTFDPPNGATNVASSTTEIRVTFNMPMRGGFSWTGGGPNYPTVVQGQKPYWSPDRKTCALPVALRPNWSYELGLNSPSHKNFKSDGGVPLVPVRYRFSTGS